MDREDQNERKSVCVCEEQSKTERGSIEVEGTLLCRFEHEQSK
jgi:hypothetical protein